MSNFLLRIYNRSRLLVFQIAERADIEVRQVTEFDFRHKTGKRKHKSKTFVEQRLPGKISPGNNAGIGSGNPAVGQTADNSGNIPHFAGALFQAEKMQGSVRPDIARVAFEYRIVCTRIEIESCSVDFKQSVDLLQKSREIFSFILVLKIFQGKKIGAILFCSTCAGSIAPEQVDEFIAEVVEPIRNRYAGQLSETTNLHV